MGMALNILFRTRLWQILPCFFHLQSHLGHCHWHRLLHWKRQANVSWHFDNNCHQGADCCKKSVLWMENVDWNIQTMESYWIFLCEDAPEFQETNYNGLKQRLSYPVFQYHFHKNPIMKLSFYSISLSCFLLKMGMCRLNKSFMSSYHMMQNKFS